MNWMSFSTSYWFRSALYSTFQRFSLIIFGFFSFFLLIRSLSIDQMATWALFLTIITLLENTKSALLKNAHIKYVTAAHSVTEKTSIASSSLLVNAGITLFFILLILIFGEQIDTLFNGKKTLHTIFLWFIPGLIAMIFFAHLEAVQQSHFDFKGVFAGNLVRQILFFSALAIHFIWKLPIHIFHLGLYQSASILFGTLTILVFSRKYLVFKFNPSLQWVKTITKYGGYIFGTGVISNIYSNLDQFMTAAVVPGSVAFYNAAKRINGFIDIPTYAAADIAFPKLSLASEVEGSGKLKYMYERMVSIILCIILPFALISILFAKPIIAIIAGDKYLVAAPVLQIYMLVSIVGVIQHQGATTLYSIGKTRLCFIVSSVSLLFNLIITFGLLKTIGFYGAAVGALISSSISSIAWLLIMKKEIGFAVANIALYGKQNYKMVWEALKKLTSPLQEK